MGYVAIHTCFISLFARVGMLCRPCGNLGKDHDILLFIFSILTQQIITSKGSGNKSCRNMEVTIQAEMELDDLFYRNTHGII